MKVNKLIKIIFAFIIFVLVINVKALDNQIVIEDDANVISSYEYTTYKKYLSNFVDMGNVYFKIISIGRELSDGDLINYYNSKFANTDGLIILYNKATNKYYLFGIGDKYQKINNSRDEIIGSVTNVDNVRSKTSSILLKSCYKVKSVYDCVMFKNYSDNFTYNDTVIASNFENEATKNPSYTNENTNYQVIMDDRENLLSQDEENRLFNRMIPLTKYGNVAFVSISCSTSTSSCANDYYHALFKQDSGTIFMIDMKNRMIYIFSDGANYNLITDDKAEIITDNIYTYASAGNYYECADKAFEQIGTILDGGKILEPMRYITNMFLALFLGFLICFVIVIITSLNKKTSKYERRKNYIYNLAIANFLATENGTTKVFNPVIDSTTSSGFSSGGGGGFSSGGFSSGGGGGGFSGGGGGGGHSGGGGGHGF